MPNLSITFDSNTASNNRDVHFITMTHPLVQQAAKEFLVGYKSMISISIHDETIKSGIYPFAIYSWNYSGLKPTTKLIPISSDKSVDEILIDVLSYSNENTNIDLVQYQDAWDELENLHYKKWLQGRKQYIENNKLESKYRLEQQLSQCDSRMRYLLNRIQGIEDERIKRMYQSQVSKIDMEKLQYKRSYEEFVTKVDIETTLLVKGVLEVKN